MLLKHWLTSLQRCLSFKTQPSRRKDPRQRNLLNRSIPAESEILEYRTLLTAFVVNTLDDAVAVDGSVSLREAILSANTGTAVNADVAVAGEADGDMITFDDPIAGGTIVLLLGELEITDDLSIDGADPNTIESNMIISGNNAFRIFSINTSTGGGTNRDVSLSNLNLDDGNTAGSTGDDGGAIFVADGQAVTLDTLTITNSGAAGNGGAIYAGNGTLDIRNSQIGTGTGGNHAGGVVGVNGGGGIFNAGGMLTVANSTIASNTVHGIIGSGGGIFNAAGGSVNISRITIIGNFAHGTHPADGGGLFNSGTASISDSTLSGNSSDGQGGGLWNNGTLQLSQVTVSGNTSITGGGGIYTEGTGSLDIRNSTITLNSASGNGGGLGIDGVDGEVYLESTIVARNIQMAAAGDVNGTVVATSQYNLIGINTGVVGLIHGTNNNIVGTGTPIDPLLGSLADNGGPTMTHLLLSGSPAFNRGSNPDDQDFDQRGEDFLRTIGSQTDIGALEVQIPFTAVGGGPGENRVRIFDALTGTLITELTPYGPSFLGGIRTAVADVDGDGTWDLITGAGPGGGPHVKVLNGADDFTTELFSFFAFNDPNFSGGIFVAAANFNPGTGAGQDNNADIVVSADAGGGSRVTVYEGTPVPLGTGPTVRQDFFAYGPAFFGGVRVATGDFTGDGIPDIITGAGPGGTPHIRVFDGSLMQVTPMPLDIGGPLGSFYAFDTAFAGGVYVATGDIDGNGMEDIIAGAGRGGGPRVDVYANLSGTQSTILSFFAYPANIAGGVTVGSIQGSDNDGLDDLITGTGQGDGPHLKIISGDTGMAVERASLFAFDPAFTGGIFVGGSPGHSTRNTLHFGGGNITGGTTPLTQSQLDVLMEAALVRLGDAGVSTVAINTLSTVDVRVSSLGPGLLGRSLPGSILIDVDAAGAGWYIDPSPLDDVEFKADLNAVDAAALGRVDLLTVLLHELGHQLGVADLDIMHDPDNLMTASLPTGKRRLPDEDLDNLFANSDALGSVLS